MRLAVFAYGSLVSRASVAATLGRYGDPAGVWPATLPGWRRRFTLRRDNLRSEKTFALADGSVPEWVLGLNIEAAGDGDPGTAPNGALIEVTAAELERLDRRELRYSRVDVSGDAEPAPGAPSYERVFAYTAKPANLATGPMLGAVVLRSYVAAVEAAFDSLGPGELAAYSASTELPGAEVVDARLIRDQIPAGNPRDW